MAKDKNKNMNCMNVCLGNQWLIEVDKYAKKAKLNRDEAIQKLIQIAENELERSTKTSWRTQYVYDEEFITFKIPVHHPAPTATWYSVDDDDPGF